MITKAFSYKVWADRRTLGAVEEVDSDRCSKDYASILQQLNHMVIVAELFRSRLLASNAWYMGFVSAHADMTREIVFDFADGKRGKMSVEEILFHIVNHGSYHRGNIARALDSAGVEHPSDGYGLFIHKVEAQLRAS